MKLKYYLRGLGVGIICTAIIMGIALSGKEKERLTEAEIIERARLLGMVMAEEEEPEEPDEPEEIEENQDNPDIEGTQNNQENQVPQMEDQESVVPETPVEEPTEEPVAEPEIKTIEVLPGEYSDVVSQKLFEAGLIPDAEAFNKYLMDSGQDQNIMVGVHQIPMGTSEDEIIKILGEKPE